MKKNASCWSCRRNWRAAQLKRARNRARDRSHAAVHAFLNFKQLANSAGSLISNRQLFKIALLPTRWQYRLLLGGALLAWEYWRLQRDVRPVVKDDNIIDVTPEYPKLPYRRCLKSSLHFQIQKVQAAFWGCAANGAASAICSLPPRGRVGERALGTHGELGCRLLFESGYGGDTPCSVFEFSAARPSVPSPTEEAMGAGCFEGFRQSLKRFLQRSEKRKNSTKARTSVR